MTYKILMLLEDIVNLGVAKYLKENCDCELYALIDTQNRTKKFFQNQKIVDFHKVWYLRDHIIKSNKNYDLNYLSNVEKKYNIHLWRIVRGDRIFTNHDGTNNYHKFNRDEILQLLEQECKLYEQILDYVNPDFLIIKNAEYAQSFILLELSKARNIKLLILGGSRLGTLSIISSEVDQIDNFEKKIHNAKNIKSRSWEEVLKISEGYVTQIKVMNEDINVKMLRMKIQAGWYMLTKVLDNKYREFYVHYGRTRLRVLINETNKILKRWRREVFINKNLKRELDVDVKFVYFPLPLQPERSTLSGAPHYTNQIEIISQITQSLPIGFKLYVKEHPSQTFSNWRDPSFYKNIQNILNVELFHHSVSFTEMLKHSSLVISVNGTSCLEAAYYGKPSIVFSDTIYSSLPSVFRVRSYEDLPSIITQALNTKVDLLDLNKYIDTILENSFNYEYIRIHTSIANRLDNSVYVPDIEISEKEAVEILEDLKEDINILGLEYLKKISQHTKAELMKE